MAKIYERLLYTNRLRQKRRASFDPQRENLLGENSIRTGGRERLYCFPLFAHGQLITTSVTSHSNRSKLSLAWLV